MAASQPDSEALERIRGLLTAPPTSRPPDFTNPLEKIEQLLTCPICLDRYKQPRLLPCQHTFCHPCLENCLDVSGRNLKCPECRAEHSIPFDGVKGFQTNLTLTGFLDIHLQASAENAAELEAYIQRYNRETCKVCSEKSELELCPHCDKRACTECRTLHMETLRRDLARLLNQVKRLSNRITDAAGNLSKGAESLRVNCEATKSEVREYFLRYVRELKRREDHFLLEIDLFHQNESRVVTALRDVLQLESDNMTEACSWLDQALAGSKKVEDVQLVKFKNTFQGGLEYLRNFQPDSEDLFGKKIRFSPGDDASKLPSAISNFGELNVCLPQFAGRYLPLEHSYLPKHFRYGLESDSLKGSAASSRRNNDLEERPSSRYSNRSNGDDDSSSLRYRRRQQLEEEAWNRLRVGTGIESGRNSPSNHSPGNSPWTRSPLTSMTNSNSEDNSKNSSPPEPSTLLAAIPSLTKSSSRKKELSTRRSKDLPVVAVEPPSPVPAPSAPALAGPSKSLPPVHSAKASTKPPLPRQQNSTEESALNDKIESIRIAYEQRQKRAGAPPPVEAAKIEEKPQAPFTPPQQKPAPIQKSEEEEEAPKSSPTPQRFRIVCKSAVNPGVVTPTSSVVSSSNSFPVAAEAAPPAPKPEPKAEPLKPAEPEPEEVSSPAHPIPITYFPGEQRPPRYSEPAPEREIQQHNTSTSTYVSSANSSSTNPQQQDHSSPPSTPPWLLRRRQRFMRSKTNPDMLLEHSLSSSRVQQLLLERSNRLESSTIHRVGAPPRSDSVESASNDLPPHFQAERLASVPSEQPRRSRFRRRSSIVPERELSRGPSINSAIDYLAKGCPKVVFGRKGQKPGELNWPRGITPLSSGEIGIADSSNHRICIFNTDGRLMRTFGKYGTNGGDFDSLAAVIYDKYRMQIIVSDRYNHRIQIFDYNGGFVREFGKHGPQNGNFNNPWGLALDDCGQIYVCDKDNHRVQFFNQNGQYLGRIGSKGQGSNEFHNPLFIAIHRRTQQIYISDSSNHRISVFSHERQPLFRFGFEGFHTGQLKFPRGIAVDNDGYIVVADSGNNRIQVFSPDGKFLHSWGSWGAAPGQLKGIESVAIADGSLIVVSDRENHRIQIF